MKGIYDSYLQELEEGFDIFYYSDIGNSNLRPHMHPYYEVYMLVGGEIAYHTCNGIVKLNAGDILFINKNETHCPILINPSTPYERIVLDITSEKLDKLSQNKINLAECFQCNKHRVYRFPHDVLNMLRLTLGNILILKQTKPFGYDLLADAYLTELFVILNQYINDHATITLTDELKPNQLLAILEQYINENLDRDISIDELAKFVCMSKYYFMRSFKKLTGKTVYQYIIEKRLENAKALINSGVDYTKAGQQCGFSDYSCFYRAFLKKYCVSPREYFQNKTNCQTSS